jgi:hypothetical protein
MSSVKDCNRLTLSEIVLHGTLCPNETKWRKIHRISDPLTAERSKPVPGRVQAPHQFRALSVGASWNGATNGRSELVPSVSEWIVK